MTPASPRAALARYGYTGPAADFLTLVLRHTGVFLRRQYLHACGVGSGGADTRFLSRLLTLRHAQRRIYYAREHVYHVTSKALYAAINQPNSRLRRLSDDILRAQRLMTLDFMLEHLDHQYLVSEDERVDLFTGPYGVAREHLPQQRYPASAPGGPETIRFFVERFPLFLKAGTSTVFFVFPQVTYSAGAHAFGTFLARYAGLFGRLPASEIVYLHAQDVDPTPAVRLFRQFVAPPRVIFVARLHRHFTARARLAHQPGLTTPERQQYERDRVQFRDVPERWYTRWLAEGRTALHDLASTLADDTPFPTLHFRPLPMPYVYAYHGTQSSAGSRRLHGDRRAPMPSAPRVRSSP
jgi:hypothetical protein